MISFVGYDKLLCYRVGTGISAATDIMRWAREEVPAWGCRERARDPLHGRRTGCSRVVTRVPVQHRRSLLCAWHGWCFRDVPGRDGGVRRMEGEHTLLSDRKRDARFVSTIVMRAYQGRQRVGSWKSANVLFS